MYLVSSCCLVKPDNGTQCARQVERQFMGELHPCLPGLVGSLPLDEGSTLAPILAHYVGQFLEDSHISKTALEW